MIGNNDVRDPDGYMKEYLPLVQATLKAHGAVYVAAGKGTASRQRAGSSSFDGIAWSSCLLGDSPEYEAARKIGAKYAKYNVIAVESVQP